MPSTQPEQTLNLQYAVEGPPPERMPTNELTGAIAEVHMNLAAISHHSFSIYNSIQSCQTALIQLNQQQSAFKEAYLAKIQDITKTNEVLRTRLDDMNREMFELRNFNASLERDYYETQVANENMKLLLEDLHTDNKTFSREKRKTDAEHQQALAAAECRAQAAELALQQHNVGTPNEAPRASDVVDGVVRPATVVHGGVRIVNSDSNPGFENTQLTPTGACPDQAQTSGGPEHKKCRSRLRRQKTDISQLPLKLPESDP